MGPKRESSKLKKRKSKKKKEEEEDEEEDEEKMKQKKMMMMVKFFLVQFLFLSRKHITPCMQLIHFKEKNSIILKCKAMYDLFLNCTVSFFYILNTLPCPGGVFNSH